MDIIIFPTKGKRSLASEQSLSFLAEKALTTNIGYLGGGGMYKKVVAIVLSDIYIHISVRL